MNDSGETSYQEETSMLKDARVHSEHVTSEMHVTIGQTRCEYRGVSLTIAALAQQIQGQVSGHVTIPEDQEYRHALTLVTVGKELHTSARRMWEIYTGYDDS